MSGPKVVRIITKQEVIAICKSRIIALQDEKDRWHKYASKHDALTEAMEKNVERKFQAVLEMFEREQFSAVQKQCTDEIATLQKDINRIREEAIAKTEQERSKRRRLQYSAETLIKTLESTQRQIPKELLNIASNALTANEIDLATMNLMMSRLLTEYTLRTVGQQGMTPMQEELSKKLTEGEKIQTLVDWKIFQDGNIKAEDINCRLDKLLAEIEAMESKENAKPFLDRAILIARESLAGRRSLLTDSLIFDLIAYLNEQKMRSQELDLMREMRCELRRLTSMLAKDLENQITKAIDAKDISSGKVLINKGRVLIKEETNAIVGNSRREAILRGLSELGYEVRESMFTAWAEDGRIVIKKPNEKMYGVEIGATENAERVQMQLVSFEQSTDALKAIRDLDRETIWCSELNHLKSLLEKSGTALHVEKALPVGSKPLKQVQESSIILDRETRSRNFKIKQLKHD